MRYEKVPRMPNTRETPYTFQAGFLIRALQVSRGLSVTRDYWWKVFDCLPFGSRKATIKRSLKS